MTQGALVGDMGSEHEGYPATPIISGSPTVKIDGKAVARKGDALTAHDKPKHPSHPRFIKEGSSSVKIDGLPAARVGDAISCGGVIVGGSSVNIG
ncbi:type VI secretion system PAAR protein [Vibrio parahaemolyticus]|uniref:type VI secretion system PAAR protein n=1 Tax=Vibrio owensii TaxID=696485 RepID=UPI001A35E52A|nr:type VI secretion system PAAR protein [Vibrio owensii]EGQ7810703.1 type VI secretion system PAAR protein [Vibrio parahaemolyticus]MDA0385197.1 type VI secretion system PAAR protein [Vibrio owensii]